MKIFKLLFLAVAKLFFVFNLNAQLTYTQLKVEYDSAWTFKNLQVIPVRYKHNPAPFLTAAVGNLSLSEALQNHKAKLQEMQYKNGADINWLQITNHSKHSIIVRSGEIVSGGKQDRMIAETKIISPGTIDYIHVFCVEKRRWDDKPKDFRYEGVANSELRKAMDVTARQAEVWKEVDRQFSANKKTSETWSYIQLYKEAAKTDTAYINYFTRKYRETDSAFAGYLFITGNRIIGCELFASADLTNNSFSNMLTGYVHSAIANGATPAVTLNKKKEFMDKILSSEQSQKSFVTLHGKFDLKAGKIIHLIAYGD